MNTSLVLIIVKVSRNQVFLMLKIREHFRFEWNIRSKGYHLICTHSIQQLSLITYFVCATGLATEDIKWVINRVTIYYIIQSRTLGKGTNKSN